MNKLAYEAGAARALIDAGIIKQGDDNAIWPALFGPIGGAITAPEGKGWSGFGGTMAGQAVGGAAGGLGGAGIGALLGLLAKNPGMGAMIGGGAGGLLGSGLGAAKGYRMAVGPKRERHVVEE